MLRGSSCLIMMMFFVGAGEFCFAGEDAPFADDEACPACAPDEVRAEGASPQVEWKTDDDSLIRVKRQCIMVDFAEGELLVSEVLTAVNDGARTVVPKNAGRGSFRVLLPAGAVNVRTGGDIDPKLVRITDRQAVYSGEIRPGSMQFVMQYTIRVTQAGFTIAWPVAYRTDRVDFIFPDDIAGASVSSTDFDGRRVAMMGTRPYRHLMARAKQPGTSFTVSLTVPVAPGNAFRWPAFAAAVVASAAIVILRGRKGAGISSGTGV